MKWNLGIVAAGLLVLAAGSAEHASAQLLNGGFETPDASAGDVAGATDWITFNGVFTTSIIGPDSIALHAHTGLQSVKTFGPFGAPGGGAGGSQTVPAAPGETWVGGIYGLNSSLDSLTAPDFGVFKIEFLDAGFALAAGGLAGVDIFESADSINTNTPHDVWKYLGVGTAPAPVGTAWARAVFVKVDLDGCPPCGAGSIFWDDAFMGEESQVVGVPPSNPEMNFVVHQNEPNPFNPTTSIRFELTQSDDVELSVYDVSGRKVITLIQEQLAAGPHETAWNGESAAGTPVRSGVYFYVLTSSTGKESRAMTLVR